MLQFKNRKVIKREQLLEECQSLVFESKSSNIYNTLNNTSEPNFAEVISNPTFQSLIPELSQVMSIQIAPSRPHKLSTSTSYQQNQNQKNQGTSKRTKKLLIRIHFLGIQEVERAINHFHYTCPKFVSLSTNSNWDKT